MEDNHTLGYNSYGVSYSEADVIHKEFQSAMLLVRNGDYHSAEKIFKKLKEQYPSDYRGYLGVCIVFTNNFSESGAKKMADHSVNVYWKQYQDRKMTSHEIENLIRTNIQHRKEVIWPQAFKTNMHNAIALANSNQVNELFSNFAKRCLLFQEPHFDEWIRKYKERRDIALVEEKLRHAYIGKQVDTQKKNSQIYNAYTVVRNIAFIIGLFALPYLILNANVIPEEGNEQLYRVMAFIMLTAFGVAIFVNSRRKKYRQNISK